MINCVPPIFVQIIYHVIEYASANDKRFYKQLLIYTYLKISNCITKAKCLELKELGRAKTFG